MTPQLQQAIRLLQMSRLELVETVHQELLENPVLEEQNEAASESAATDSPNGTESGAETRTLPDDGGTEARESAQANGEANRRAEEIDWDRYVENHVMQAPVPSGGSRGHEDLPGLEATLTRTEDLAAHLEWQVRMSDFVEDERRFATLVIGNLDENGYLTLEGIAPTDVVPRLAGEAGLDAEDAEEILHIIQRLDPIGVAARDLRECLRTQAEHLGTDETVLRVIGEHLPDLERRNYAAIAKALGVELAEVYDVAQFIADLEPRPARNFVTAEPQYIVPDVWVHRVGDKHFVVANDDGMPRLKISSFYRTAMKGSPEAREYIQTKLRSAQWLIRSIDQRRKTIERVTECIVEKQNEFFEKGIAYLKPMILRDVAEQIGMHESTVSRVTSNKYVATPRGVYELKYFFNSAIRRTGDDDIASESVKEAIKELIDGESPEQPHSDQRLVDLLAARDIVIARRTVAKYREVLGILSSSKRRKYF